MRTGADTQEGGGPQALRKLQIWKAETASLLLSPATSKAYVTGNMEDERQIQGEIVRLGLKAFPYRLFYYMPDWEDWRDCVLYLIEQVVKLDLEISKQGAHIDWVFDLVGNTVPGAAAAVPSSSSSSVGGQQAMKPVITVPALTKLGKSNGEDLDKETKVLLQAEEASAF
ncbi:hypothetical protein PG997_011528 [Apiospora hydei]|uniref:Uncharacterized protein n=1 Tax=Apiospora hydei TaxID=1337664 RepID=A0ABR1VJD6_9PEZI